MYLLNEQSVNDRLKISYGVRFNLYSLLGPYEELSFSGNHVSLKEHEAGIIDTKSGIEPRLGLSYKTGVNSALKLNYNRTMQYLQLLSNSVSSFSVLDVWYPANRKIDPASSTNYSLGWFLKFAKNKYRFSSEIYYRKLKKQLDFDDYIVPVYGEKNKGRIPDYHRLDLSFTLKNKRKPGRKNQGSWVFSLYNAYGRLNALTVFVGPVMKDINIIEDKNRIAYQKLSLFSVIPGVTYNFKF